MRFRRKKSRLDDRGEADLLERCRAGEEAARDELYRKYWPLTLRMARHIEGAAEESEDLAQEAFCRLFHHLRGLRGEASISTWLYRVMVNIHRDRLRRLSKRREYPLEAVPPHMSAPDPAEEVEGRLWRRRIVQIAKGFSRPDRKLLWFRFRREYSHAQIASRLNCTVDAVKCRLFRLTRQLRQKMAFDL